MSATFDPLLGKMRTTTENAESGTGTGMTLELTADATETYILQITNAHTYLRKSFATAHSITVPPQGDVAWEVGTVITVRNVGPGSLSFNAGTGVTLAPDDLEIDEYGTTQLIRVAENTWDLL